MSSRPIMTSVYAVVLAGGSGVRFWPASRARRPKQLLAIGPAQESLVVETVRRIAGMCPPERILVATSESLLDAMRRELPWLPEASFLAEPLPRNTAPCIGWATERILRRDPDATVMVLPSDQHAADEGAFQAAVARAIESADDGSMTVLGIEATRPETGYGYIEVGRQVCGPLYDVERFVEKPDRETAERYLASGRFLWNAGMFFFKARAMHEAIAEHLPGLARGLARIERAALGGHREEHAETERVFSELEGISLDHGIMERTQGTRVVRAEFGWSDLGSWESIWELGDRDGQGNVLPDSSVAIDARDNLVTQIGGAKRAVALVGVEGLCIVETDDALLVVPRARAQEVRAVVEALRAKGQGELL